MLSGLIDRRQPSNEGLHMRKDHQSMTINGWFEGPGKRHLSHSQTRHAESTEGGPQRRLRATDAHTGSPALTQVERV
jgi:hypothetical protein